MRVEQLADVGLRLLEDALHRAAGLVVAQHLGDDALVDRTGLDRVEAQQRAGHAERADHLRGERRRAHEVAARAGARLAEEELLGRHAAEADLDARDELGAGARVALLRVGVREQTERVACA